MLAQWFRSPLITRWLVDLLKPSHLSNQTAKCHLMQIRRWGMQDSLEIKGWLNGSYRNDNHGCFFAFSIHLVHLKINPIHIVQCIIILLVLYITCQRFQLYSIAIHGGQICILYMHKSRMTHSSGQNTDLFQAHSVLQRHWYQSQGLN